MPCSIASGPSIQSRRLRRANHQQTPPSNIANHHLEWHIAERRCSLMPSLEFLMPDCSQPAGVCGPLAAVRRLVVHQKSIAKNTLGNAPTGTTVCWLIKVGWAAHMPARLRSWPDKLDRMRIDLFSRPLCEPIGPNEGRGYPAAHSVPGAGERSRHQRVHSLAQPQGQTTPLQPLSLRNAALHLPTITVVTDSFHAYAGAAMPPDT